jgi:glycerol kinase
LKADTGLDSPDRQALVPLIQHQPGKPESIGSRVEHRRFLWRGKGYGDGQRIAISGGLSRCDYLCQVLAGLSGLKVERMSQCEATARGVAFLAAGLPDGWTDVPVERVFDIEAGTGLAARFAAWRAELERRLD